MTYQDFNLIVYDQILERAHEVFFNLHFEQQDFPDQKFDFKELQEDWGSLINSDDAVPLYFGLIAIQCIAASNMETAGEHKATQYISRLRELLQLDDVNRLKRLFEGPDRAAPAQERIWREAQRHLRDGQGVCLTLPENKKFKDRYIQFPKSQVLLNKEDLKQFTPFFAEEFRRNELISYEFFEEKLLAYQANFARDITRAKARELLVGERRDLCYRQIFNYYNRWDGTICELQTRVEQYRKTLAYNREQIQMSIILSFENDIPNFSLNELSIDSESIFGRTDYQYFRPLSGYLLFNHCEYYDDYEDSRYLAPNKIGYVLLHREHLLESRWVVAVLRNSLLKVELGGSLILHKIDSSIPELNKFVSIERPVSLQHGIRISRKLEYVRGFGPSILEKSPYKVIYNHKIIEYDPQSALEGEYKVRVDRFTDLVFSIVKATDLSKIVEPLGKGWMLSNFDFSLQDYDVEAALFVTTQPKSNLSITRRWIQSNINGSYIAIENNVLLNAIIKHKNVSFKFVRYN